MPELLAIIAARGGSKALPRKNVLPLGGKPLIAWTIQAALRSRAVTRTVVSTDDAEIAVVAKECGAELPFVRPPHLATDSSPSLDAIRHALGWLKEHEGYWPDQVLYLQPTSPLRTEHDIDRAAALLIEREADAVVGVVPVKHHPYWTQAIDASGWMHDFVAQPTRVNTRQELPPAYAVNGAIYLASSGVVMEHGWFTERTAAYIMPPDRSIDIDTATDFRIAELLVGDTHCV